MPLIKKKSKEAFSKNVKTEMEAGKPQKQALAIAYSVKRHNRKKMASGGDIVGVVKELAPMALMSEGGKLDANARKHIAPKNFALPGGRYPIEDESHARNALARVSQHGSSEEKEKVRSKVHSKYPGIEMKKALGGAIESPDYSGHPFDQEPAMPMSKKDDERPAEHEYMSSEMGGKYADGGFVDSSDDKITADSITPEELRMIGDYRRKMALGGAVESPDYSGHPYDRNPGTPEPKLDNRRLDPKDYMSEQWAGGPDPVRKPDNMRPPMDEYMSDEMGGKYAEGGMIDHIRMKMKLKKMADGGMVDLSEEGSTSQTPIYPERNSAILKENYDSEMLKMKQPEDSNEHGDNLREDDERGETHESKKKSTVDAIMQRRMKRSK